MTGYGQGGAWICVRVYRGIRQEMVAVLSDVLRPRCRFVESIDRGILCRYSVTEVMAMRSVTSRGDTT